MTDLLFEIGTEEIPASYITPALNQMKALFTERAKKHRLEVQSLYCTGTPRRLTLFVRGLPQRQESVTEEVQGPAASIAFDKTGNPTKAGLGFAKSQGVDIHNLQIKKTTKGEYCFAIKQAEGQETLHILPEILAEIIKGISFPKSMKWKGNNLFFARPIRSLLALFGDKVVPMEINGIKADKFAFGHPFLSGKRIEISRADWDLYMQLLRQEKVVADMTERRETLRAKITHLMASHSASMDDEELLDEVTNLVEYPHAVECSFDEEFLDIPGDVIETAMKEHQRYFPIKKRDGNLSNKFIAVVNRDESNAQTAVQGNERVLKARLSDARFFWKEDRKLPLEKRVDDLKNLAFLEKLGNYRDRTDRIVNLSEYLSHRLIALNQLPIEADARIKRAALLCKADLLTQMVGEFPSLQGIMGREYAKWDGEEPAIATAIAEHYMPRFATDTIPASKIGAVVGLADKFDTICSCFALQLTPTGSQDPYSLRRHAYGIIRIIEECEFTLEIQEVLSRAFSLLPLFLKKPERNHHQAAQDKHMQGIKDFFRDRLFQINIERGHRHDLINAVLNTGAGFNDIHDFSQRLQALSRVSKECWWPDLVTVVERTFNIGKKATSIGSVEEHLFTEPEERKLWDIYKKNKDTVQNHVTEKRYEEACRAYYEVFARTVHSFFDKVYVNVEDESVRNNRLLLVKTINELYSEKIADLSHMEMSGNKNQAS
ncbi:MAG: glycine--tRNA ligase subunit beta [Planctomycetia bacterium]|nr:glycine--tRNA ligase subunit beta [Candidatus Brocadia sp.]QOJ05405.1 MAG: glycine--tRNA ligase subunit beta [Planctomycetia bacterium]TVL98149.1 MAG: glycine--tRNA ligase subunit beta [Candidatus Brocadia sp. BL1]HQU31843.1 glycine--tRNA ligase subunit beta [Candidatus Brocadia sapporoensis]